MLRAREYPRRFHLKDGSPVTIRLAAEEDENALIDFFHKVAPEERMSYPVDMTKEPFVAKLLGAQKSGDSVVLVALSKRDVVGIAALEREKTGWTRHVGKIRLTIAEAWRGQGLGTKLATELIDNAVDLDLERVSVELLAIQEDARRAFEHLGFECVATLGRYAKDHQGRLHDLCIYSMPVVELWDLY
jgi:RimJ/RimL family protein N-acetyltransferase